MLRQTSMALLVSASAATVVAAQCQPTPLSVTVDRLDGSGNPSLVGADVGRDVDVISDRIAVSSIRDELFRFQSASPFRGAVWILEPQSGGSGAWVEAAKLRGAFDAASTFGWRVEFVSPDELLVANPGSCVIDCLPVGPSGSIHVFQRVLGSWIETQVLSAPMPFDNDLFSVDMSVDGSLLAVGASAAGAFSPGQVGSVHVFERTQAGWQHRVRILSPAPSPDRNFGRAVDLAAGCLVVGDPGVPVAAGFAGAAHVYRIGAGPGVWTLAASLGPAPSDLNRSKFGHAVATDGFQVLVGAPCGDLSADPIAVAATEPGAVQSGRVDVFKQVGSVWRRVSILAPPVPEIATDFGDSMDLEAGRLVVGWPRSVARAGSATAAGAVVVYEQQLGSWAVMDVIAPSSLDGGASPVTTGDRIGNAVALDGDRLVVGANTASLSTAPNRGTAVTIDLAGDRCHPSRLHGAPGLVSVAFGGPHVWGIRGDGLSAGGAYLVLGSISGTSPGFSLGAVTVPLNPDAYLNGTILSANQGPFVATFGVLDSSSGRGTAVFVLPAGLDPVLIGLELHHSALLVAPGSFQVVHATTAARLAFVP